MRASLLEVLACPACRGPLGPGEPPALPSGDLEHGSLACWGCGRVYPVVDGVPVLLPDGTRDAVYDSFEIEWELRFRGAAEHAGWLWGKDLGTLPYSVRAAGWYLDCGCGCGETVAEVARRNPHLQAVGLDVTGSVRRARARAACVPNLHFVQGDVLNPPLRPRSFSFILALGVWHHTPDPERALHNTVGLLARSGTLSAWLYPELGDLERAGATLELRKWRRYYFLRDRLGAGHAHRLPPRLLLGLCRALSCVVSPFGHLLGQRVPALSDRYRSNLFLLFDDLASVYQHRVPRTTVLEWFRAAGAPRVLHSFERGGVYTATVTHRASVDAGRPA